VPPSPWTHPLCGRFDRLYGRLGHLSYGREEGKALGSLWRQRENLFHSPSGSLGSGRRAKGPH
jgi:hypothetical protein